MQHTSPTPTATTEILARRLFEIEESQTLAMARKSRELKEQGIEVINLNLGEPDFPTPDHIKAAAKQAIDDNFSFYPPVSGFLDLRKAICEKLRRENNLHYTPEQIVVSTGAKQSIANVMLSIVNPGDEVLIFSPYWVSYSGLVQLAQGRPVLVKASLENDYKVTPAQVAAALTPKTKAVIFSSPCNPTGSVFSEAELRAIAQVLAPYPNLIIIADEIYEHIHFGEKPFSIGAIESLKDRVVTINGMSKGFAMTGWRLGYAAAPLAIAKACDKIQGQITSGANTIAQRAALAALNSDLAPTKAMNEAYLRRRNLIKSLLDDIEGLKSNLPEGAFYIFPDVSAFFGKSYQTYRIQNSEDLCMYLLNEAHVSLVMGEAFGEPNCVRISFAASDAHIVEGLRRLKTALAKLS
jgi:aspartate aminotransferase